MYMCPYKDRDVPERQHKNVRSMIPLVLVRNLIATEIDD